MRMRWLAVSGVVLMVAALALQTIAPWVWPAAFFGRAAGEPGVMGSAMMQGGMMGSGITGSGMMGQGGMMGNLMSGELLGDSSQPFDLRWLDTMILHHQGGVQMTEHMVTQSARPELRDLATRIITAQQHEIDQMQVWRAAWYPDAPALSTTTPMMGGAMMGAGMPTDQMRQMMGGVDLDAMFLQMMIPHHEGAITIAEQALTEAEHPEIKTLALVIITAQRAEITEMQSALRYQ